MVVIKVIVKIGRKRAQRDASTQTEALEGTTDQASQTEALENRSPAPLVARARPGMDYSSTSPAGSSTPTEPWDPEAETALDLKIEADTDLDLMISGG